MARPYRISKGGKSPVWTNIAALMIYPSQRTLTAQTQKRTPEATTGNFKANQLADRIVIPLS